MDPSPFDHIPQILRDSFDGALDELFSFFGSCQRRCRIRLVSPHVGTDVFRKRS